MNREVVPRLVDTANISNGGVLQGGATQTDGVIEWVLSNVTTLNLTYDMRPADCRFDVQLEGSSWVSDPYEAPVAGDAAIAGTEVVASDLESWQTTEIGAAASGASQALAEHDLLVRGDGAGVTGARDSFHFTHVQQTGDFELLCWGELKPNGAKLGSEMIRAFQKQGELIRYVAKPLDVRDIPAGLYRKLEILRGAVAPSLEHLGGGEAIEAGVDLDRVEVAGVVGEPVRGAQARRIEVAAPLRMAPAGGADAEAAGLLRGKHGGD